MPSATKASLANGGTPKAKEGVQKRIVILKLSPSSLATFAPPPASPVKTEPEAPSSTTTSNTLPAAESSPGDNGVDSGSNTPAPSGGESSSAMPPPPDVGKKPAKTGVKRSSAAADGLLKPRGKPGPKKRVKLEDGATDTNSNQGKGPSTGPAAAHKLGPKANQGAINAGLRALDRSGKPCRKWQKSTFKIKTFTGQVWEIPRWTAPAKITINGEPEESTSGSSSKENKESSQMDSEKSNSAEDLDIGSMASIQPSSPAPLISAAA